MCEFAEHHHTSFSKSNYTPSKPFTIFHNELLGPSWYPNRTHARCFNTFNDDNSHVCWVYLLKDKTDVKTVFINSHSIIQTQFQTQSQILPNLLVIPSKITLKPITLFTKLHIYIHHNKMGLLNEKINIS